MPKAPDQKGPLPLGLLLFLTCVPLPLPVQAPVDVGRQCSACWLRNDLSPSLLSFSSALSSLTSLQSSSKVTFEEVIWLLCVGWSSC